jgi:uncharacterized protein (DUF427 family)
MTSPITIHAATQRWRVLYQGHVIADSADALVVEEPVHGQVVYFPRQDVSTEYLHDNGWRLCDPERGEAVCYTLLMDGQFAENAAWSYPHPSDETQLLRDRLGFDPAKVEVYAVAEDQVNPKGRRVQVDEAVQHTDAGDGRSQREPWPATTEEARSFAP